MNKDLSSIGCPLCGEISETLLTDVNRLIDTKSTSNIMMVIIID
jgi:hypothetical protein